MNLRLKLFYRIDSCFDGDAFLCVKDENFGYDHFKQRISKMFRHKKIDLSTTITNATTF